MHTADYQQFAAWAVGAMVVQMLVYAITTRLLRMSKDQIEGNNWPSAACWARSRCPSASSTPPAFPELSRPLNQT
jgi:uncharacterized membrane protein YjfL (UPF0719 family)